MVTDWAHIVDLIAYNYKWSIEEILKLTMKQVDSFIVAIGSRRDDSLKTEAALHGISLDGESKASETKSNEIMLTEEQEKALDKICPVTEN